jgi:hypothetical protein
MAYNKIHFSPIMNVTDVALMQVPDAYNDACDAPSFSLGPEFEEEEETHPPTKTICNSNTPISPLGPSPPRKTMRLSASRSPLAMTKIKSGEYLSNKRSSRKINLNDTAAELEFTQSPVMRKVVKEGRLFCPPRDTAWPHSHSRLDAATKYYKWAMREDGDPNR